jgi:hypothetical protein
MHVGCLHRKIKRGSLFDHPGAEKIIRFFPIFDAVCNILHTFLELQVPEVVRRQAYAEPGKDSEDGYGGRNAPAGHPGCSWSGRHGC